MFDCVDVFLSVLLLVFTVGGSGGFGCGGSGGGSVAGSVAAGCGGSVAAYAGVGSFGGDLPSAQAWLRMMRFQAFVLLMAPIIIPPWFWSRPIIGGGPHVGPRPEEQCASRKFGTQGS